jgi:hypothetical protein
MRASIVTFSFAVLAACAPSTGGVSTTVPGASPAPRLPRPGQPGGAGGNSVASSTMQYVCRGKESTGWVAVDYIEDLEACASSRARYNTSVIVPLAKTVIGGMLEVCADQRIPPNWHRVQSTIGDPRCPTNKPTADVSQPTVMTIQRDR